MNDTVVTPHPSSVDQQLKKAFEVFPSSDTLHVIPTDQLDSQVLESLLHDISAEHVNFYGDDLRTVVTNPKNTTLALVRGDGSDPSHIHAMLSFNVDTFGEDHNFIGECQPFKGVGRGVEAAVYVDLLSVFVRGEADSALAINLIGHSAGFSIGRQLWGILAPYNAEGANGGVVEVQFSYFEETSHTQPDCQVGCHRVLQPMAQTMDSGFWQGVQSARKNEASDPGAGKEVLISSVIINKVIDTMRMFAR